MMFHLILATACEGEAEQGSGICKNEASCFMPGNKAGLEHGFEPICLLTQRQAGSLYILMLIQEEQDVFLAQLP